MYIQTKRLLLKPLSNQDQTRMVFLLTNDIIKQTYLLPDFKTEEEAVKLFERLKALSLSETHYLAGIYLDKLLIGLINDVEIKNGKIELGYAVDPTYHHQGYATEALKGMIEYLFENGFHEVIAGAFESNLASIKVMVKAGMEKQNTKAEISYRGKLHKCIYYAIKNEQK